MKERTINVTLDKAKVLFNSGNKMLKKMALQAFSEDELKNNFKSIITFKDACEVLHLDCVTTFATILAWLHGFVGFRID